MRIHLFVLAALSWVLMSTPSLFAEGAGIEWDILTDQGNGIAPPAPNMQILTEHPISCMNTVFDKFINVFGIYVAAPEDAPLDYFNHTANVLAQYIDNDEDGVPDDPAVLAHLAERNFIVPVWTVADRQDFGVQARGTYCEDNIGKAASMYYDEDEWAIGGIEKAGTWDGNLEEVWHIVSSGWYAVYPEYFGVETSDSNGVIPSSLTDAMDAARGGQFMSTPDEYPKDAWYAYYDDTCGYHCQAHEYFYWILMSNLGALDSSITTKCEDSAHEWNICTKAALEQTDVIAFDLLNNYDFNLPTNIPDGSYMHFNENNNAVNGGDVSTTVAGSKGETGYVYTLVGSGDYGKSDHGDSKFSGDGGDAMDAVMNQPRGVAVGSENDLFIADYNNGRIRRVDPAEGTIETVAGGGDPVQDSSEYDGSLATAVAFYPVGICFGRDGNLYVTTDYDEVLKVNSDGIITWVAGDYALGFSGDGGPATEAGLSYPTGVFAYSDGTVLIADTNHNRIRRVDPDGTISTIAGSGPADSGGFSGDGGPATEALLDGPSGVTVGPGGEIYIADTYNHRIRKVDTDGTISTVAGNGPDGAAEGSFGGNGGPATLANLSVPINVIVTNEGTIYITDSYNHCIRRVDTEGNIDTVVGDNQAGFSGDGNPATTAQFHYPEGIAFDSEGNLYIADSWNHRVRGVMALENAGAVVVGGTDDVDFNDGSQNGTVELPSGEVGPIGLDLDAAFGDQSVRQTDSNPSAGDKITVDVFFTGAASGNAGYEVILTWDPNELNYVSFTNMDIFAGAMTIPTEGESTIQLANVIFGIGATASADAGTGGQAVFEVADTFSGVTTVTLTSAKLGTTDLTIGPGAKFVVIGGSVAKTPEEAANFDGDATVGFGDFLVFAGGFGSRSSDEGFDPRLDLDGDGAVGFGDFLMFAAVFGQTI